MMIDTQRYPQLKSLMWNNSSKTLGECEAFNLYESNWHRIDVKNLTEDEKRLVKRLIGAYANGVFLGKNFRKSDLDEHRPL